MQVQPLLLVLGVLAAAGIFVLAGFIAVSRYDSINEYLFPSFLYTLLFVPPFFPYFGLGGGWLFYLHPVQAPLLLAQAAFQPDALWQWLYGVLYAAVWIVTLFRWSERAFARFITAAEGVR